MNEYFKSVIKRASKLSDEQVKQFLDDVSDENEMFDSIIESLSTGLIVVDKEGKLVLANKAAERYLPFSVRADDARSEGRTLTSIIHDGEIATFLSDCFSKGLVNVSNEFTRETSGGSVRFINIAVLPLVKNRETAGSIITVRDITEKRNQEILLHRMENLAELTNLAASVAHEIKNPLGAISIHVQLIQKAVKKSRAASGRLPDKKFLEEHLDVVNEEIGNLNKTVMNFLMAVRPVNAKLALVDVARVIDETAKFITPEFHASHIMVHVRVSEMATRLLIDEKLFKEVLVNIAQNCMAAIQERFPDCRAGSANSACQGLFELSSEVKNDRYVITISDNGTGMSAETTRHIFEPYFTTKASGTGLGMTMVYKIIKEFSGDIQVKSALGKGTTFTIALPIPQVDRKLLEHKVEKSSTN